MPTSIESRNGPEPTLLNQLTGRGHRGACAGLMAILGLYGIMASVGMTWGLPSRDIDGYLFGDEPPWTGETIYHLSRAAYKFAAGRGADVDPDPLAPATDRTMPHPVESSAPIMLTSTPEDVARIYLRYRLYTHQPDEMITMMALAGMRPSEWRFDPRLYQYGGLFIYPVGALIKLCGLLGFIDVRSDIIFYLDNPDEFGKFYIVARAYSAAWGAIGVLVVFAIARRLSGPSTGLLAALLFTMMPVVVCMAHEGKPHLPGAVLMLMAVRLAMRFLDGRRTSCFLLMSITCGAAVGMVLSSWPICVLIPLVAWMDRRRPVACAPGSDALHPGRDERDLPRADSFGFGSDASHSPRQGANRTVTEDHTSWTIMAVKGALTAIATYFVTNPYVLVNVFANREVLRSNFGNSLAMYEVSRIGDGFVRVLELTIEGATWPIVILGTTSLLFILVVRFNKLFQDRAGRQPSEPGAQATGKQGIAKAHATSTSSTADFTSALPMVLVGVIFFVQFVLIGAGKPAEYGRFGIFTNTVLVITTSYLIFWICKSPRVRVIGLLLGLGVILMAGVKGYRYVESFRKDSGPGSSRLRAADHLLHALRILPAGRHPAVAVPAEPAPYCFPPCNFAKVNLLLVKGVSSIHDARLSSLADIILVRAVDDPMSEFIADTEQPSASDSTQESAGKIGYYRPGPEPLTPISWADKPMMIMTRMETWPSLKKQDTPQTQP